MIEIRYSEHYEEADVIGKSVAEVREKYKLVFKIPDRAKVILNRKYVRKGLEPETILEDGDELIFAERIWVEVIYSGQHDLADLAGKSVAEARELYKEPLEIPDEVQAKLNGKLVKPDMEPRMMLRDGDTLVFPQKRKKGRYLVAALLAVLVATGGMFAFTYTTATIQIGPATYTTDFGKVEAVAGTSGGYTSGPNWSWGLGWFKGSIPDGSLFKITPDISYTGDIAVTVYLTNADDLVKGYRFLHMEFQLIDQNGTLVDMRATGGGPNYQLMSLKNGEVHFILVDTGATSYYVYLRGGTYHSTPWSWLSLSSDDVSPKLYAELTQAEPKSP